MALRSPVRWFGAKTRLVDRLLPLIPQHHTYVEPFGGGASLLFAKEPSPVEVYNDLDSGLVNFFRVLRDPAKFERFYRMVCMTPYAREEFDFCRRSWQECEDDVERAYRWFVVARMSFSGHFGHSWSSVVRESRCNISASVNVWLQGVEMLPEAHARLMMVQVEHLDFRHILKRYDDKDTFFYLDPPYVRFTRKTGRYSVEMSDEDHRDMVSLLLGLKGKALLSGYSNPLYLPLEEAGWRRLDFPAVCYAAGKTDEPARARVESVWMNYAPEVKLL